jgi:nucleoside-diphosphate-sugar epimerase
MNILVTGANSFLGKEFASYFRDKKQYNLILTDRKTLDVSNREQVIEYFNGNNIDIVLHTAIKGGSRGHEDTYEDFVQNITMFNNLRSIRDRVKKIINFGSGASFDRERSINFFSEKEIFNSSCLPRDYYGLAKNLICKEILRVNDNIINFRIFGCFGSREKETRFIKSAINNYRNKEPIIIHKNKKMDFFFVEDLCAAVEFYIADHRINHMPADINIVYAEKITLLEIAQYINGLSDYRVKIKVLDDEYGKDYTGDGKALGYYHIPFVGLKKGIKSVYDSLMDGSDG